MMSIVVIPAYQPDEALISIADKFGVYGCQMVVVDDGSGEEYQSIFDKIKDICVILRHSQNLGKGAAIKTALAYIQENFPDGEMIGSIDCDGQHLPGKKDRSGNCRFIRSTGIRKILHPIFER